MSGSTIRYRHPPNRSSKYEREGRSQRPLVFASGCLVRGLLEPSPTSQIPTDEAVLQPCTDERINMEWINMEWILGRLLCHQGLLYWAIRWRVAKQTLEDMTFGAVGLSE